MDNRTKEQQELSNQFAWRLKRILTKKRINPEIFFTNIGYSQREYNRILRGSNPTLYKICKIAEGLKIDPSELLNFANESKEPYTHPPFKIC